MSENRRKAARGNERRGSKNRPTLVTTTTTTSMKDRNDAQGNPPTNAHSPSAALTSSIRTNTTITTHNTTTTTMSGNARKRRSIASGLTTTGISAPTTLTPDDTSRDCRKVTRANAPINARTPHVFNLCSDLPNLGRLGIFSCDACDRWRTKDITGRRITKPRCEMKTFLCTRELKKMGPIRIKVVCGESSHSDECKVVEDFNHVSSPLEKKAQQDSSVAIVSSDVGLKSKRAKEIEDKLKLQAEVLLLQGELKLKAQKFNDFKKKMQPFNITADNSFDPHEQFKKGIERLATNLFPGKHSKTKAQALMDVMEQYSLFNGESTASLKRNAIDYVRQLFRPWKLVKAGDTSAVGAFKSSTIEALHKVVDEKDDRLFPSLKAVCKARKLLDQEAMGLIGYECKKTKYGEVFFVDFDKSLRLLLKACNLHETAMNHSVSIALAIDGADLIRDRTHVSAGVKITDVRGVHPTTKQPLLQRSDDGEERYVRVQSFEMCQLMIIADAKDSKSLYEDVFKGFYEWGKQISNHGIPASDGEPALKPFSVTHNSDMKAAWYLSNKGGGCKTKHFFCTLCSCSRDQLLSFKIGENRCERCKRRNKRKCFHHDVCDSIKVEALLQELEAELGDYYSRNGKQFDDVRKRSKIKTDHTMIGKESDINHIDFIVPDNDAEKVKEYTQFISRECYIRGIPLSGSHLEDWHANLRACLALEARINFLLQVREWKSSGRESVPLVEVIELLIPCVLHLENRSNEKILTSIIRYGFNLFLGSSPSAGNANSYIAAMQDAIQTQVLGTMEAPSQWKLKWSKGSDGIIIDNIQVRNQVSRKMVSKMDKIIETAVSDNGTRAKLIVALQYYSNAMELLLLHRALDESEKELFQDYIDDFFEIWISMFGIDGLSNYIHLLSSGHILYFLEKYGCLYLYSQQGWEALNNTIQAYIHQNSQRGGRGSGQGKGEKSYIFPLVRFIMRDLLWKTGYGDSFFVNLESKKPI
jgi:hypothetical protein